jgi:quercetin dioxygenase-like cupin family protein
MRAKLPLFVFLIAAACGPAETVAPPPAAPVAPEPAPAPVAPAPEPVASTPAPSTAVTPAPAETLSGPDPLTVGANIYKLVFENERVRVLDVSFKPGDKIAMHAHPDHAAYVRSGGKLKVSPSTGAPQELDLKTGQGAFLPAQSHSAENVGKTPLKLVVVEIKPGNTAGAAPPGDDPLKAGPKIYKPIFEDEHVRMLQVTFEKGAKIPMHSHPDHVAYVTSAGKLHIAPEQGAAQDIDMKQGQAVFLPAQAHAAQNAGATKVQAIIFEIKPGKASK